jgi:hypothetical protein
MNDESGGIQKETTVSYFKLLFRDSTSGTVKHQSVEFSTQIRREGFPNERPKRRWGLKLDEKYGRKVSGWEVDGTGSGSCSMTGFGISDFEPSGYAIIVLVIRKIFYDSER